MSDADTQATKEKVYLFFQLVARWNTNRWTMIYIVFAGYIAAPDNTAPHEPEAVDVDA